MMYIFWIRFKDCSAVCSLRETYEIRVLGKNPTALCQKVICHKKVGWDELWRSAVIGLLYVKIASQCVHYDTFRSPLLSR